jgi:hypothetical protein
MESSPVATHVPWPASRDCSLPEAALQRWMAPLQPRPVHPDFLARCWSFGP